MVDYLNLKLDMMEEWLFCEGSQNTGRPLTGLIVLCESFWEYNDKHKWIILDHELKHNLGFNSDSFVLILKIDNVRLECLKIQYALSFNILKDNLG